MRIVIVTSWATDVIDGSGTAVFFNAFLSGLRARGHDVVIIAPNYDISDYVEVTLKRFLFNADLHANPQVQTADVLIGFDYDGYGLDPKQRPPLITSAHALYGDVLEWETDPIRTMVQAQAFFDKVSMERADVITTGSHYAKDRIVALYEIPAEKIRVIYHGMAPSAWLSLARSKLPTPNDHPVVLAVGKMYPRKRVDLLLRAIPILQAKYPDLEVRIVGDGLESEKMHELAAELKVEDHVTWLGHIRDDAVFAHEWRQADVFCHPSQQETFGYVYLEAMTLGKAIVAAKRSAAPEVIGEAGLLVDPEDPEAYAAGIGRFLSDSALRTAYGARAREQARRFTQDHMIDGYLSLIEEVIAHRANRNAEITRLPTTNQA